MRDEILSNAIGIAPRIVGIDVGTKRVGIAQADPLRMFAQPLGTYAPNVAVEKLVDMAAADGIEVIVLGWPLKEDGSEGEAVLFVKSFERRLGRALPTTTIIRWDERFSSVLAREAIRQSGARREARRDRARVDAAAAAIILQEYLDEKQD